MTKKRNPFTVYPGGGDGGGTREELLRKLDEAMSLYPSVSETVQHLDGLARLTRDVLMKAGSLQAPAAMRAQAECLALSARFMELLVALSEARQRLLGEAD